MTINAPKRLFSRYAANGTKRSKLILTVGIII
jgi:hypothetical protein